MIASDLPEETKQQIAALIFSSVNKITLTIQTVQRQQDCSSCGLFNLLLLLLHLFVLDLIQVP